MKRTVVLVVVVLLVSVGALVAQDSGVSLSAPQESPFEYFTVLLQNQLSLSASQAEVNPYPVGKLVEDPNNRFGDYKTTTNILDGNALAQMKFFVMEMAPSWKESRLNLWKVHLGVPEENDLLVTYVVGVRKDQDAKKKDPLYKECFPYLRVWLFKQEGQKYKVRYLGSYLNGFIKGVVPVTYQDKNRKVVAKCLFIEYSGIYYGGAASRVKALAFKSADFVPQVLEFAADKDNKEFEKYFQLGIGKDMSPCVDYSETRVILSGDDQAPSFIQYYHQYIGDTEELDHCEGPSQWRVFRNKKGSKYYCEEYLESLPASILPYWHAGKKL